MNRTALCIRMLQLLKARGRMQIHELAAALETNPRNVREFRKELETAGYEIVQTRGRYGGYELAGELLLPALAFTQQEEQALREAASYLEANPQFHHGEALRCALDKLLATRVDNVAATYVFAKPPTLSEQMQTFIDRCTQAIQRRKSVRITYRTLSDQTPYTILIHPYELLYYQGACYCLAYSLKAHDYRLFRFSDQRMFAFEMQPQGFERAADFVLEKYIGENGLIKGKLYFACFLVKGMRARLLAEEHIGVSCRMRWVDEQRLQVEVWMESDYALKELLLRLGSDCELCAPRELKQSMAQEITQMMTHYTCEEETVL